MIRNRVRAQVLLYDLGNSEGKTENKGCGGLRSNPPHPLFSGSSLLICVSRVLTIHIALIRKS